MTSRCLKQFINAGKSVQQLKNNISKDFLEPLGSRLAPVPNFLKLPHVTVQGRKYTLNHNGYTIAATLNTPQEVKLMCIVDLFMKEISSLSFHV
jgi:hypothetical protein